MVITVVNVFFSWYIMLSSQRLLSVKIWHLEDRQLGWHLFESSFAISAPSAIAPPILKQRPKTPRRWDQDGLDFSLMAIRKVRVFVEFAWVLCKIWPILLALFIVYTNKMCMIVIGHDCIHVPSLFVTFWSSDSWRNCSSAFFLPGNEFSYWPLAKEAVEGNEDRNALDV